LSSIFVATLAFAQAGKPAADDDLAHAFGPQPATKVFEPEHNVPAPPVADDPNAALRATFEKDFAAAQKATGAAAREQLTMAELSAVVLGGPERVRVHKQQHAVAAGLKDAKGLREADEKWLAACGPNDVATCRTEALEAIAAYDSARAAKVRAADACLVAAEQEPGKPTPPCLEGAAALYQKANDTLMVARVDLLRALALASGKKQAAAAKKALAKITALTDDRCAYVRRTAFETLSRLDLEAGDAEAAVKDAAQASDAWAGALPPSQRPWARSPALDPACAAYEKVKPPGACRKLEKRLMGGDYVFHDFSTERLEGGQLISHEKLVAVNEHYNVLIKNCLAAEIQALEDHATVMYRVTWLVVNDGRVDNFHSESTDQEQSHFVQCLREQFGYWRYPRHEGDPQRIQQTFSVKSRTRTTEEQE
jgi:hypothetical protein